MQIDLKNCDIYFIDGYSNAGAINHMAGYSAGVTTITVDGFTTAPAVGARFTVGSDPDEYTIQSSTTTSITFTPALVNDCADNDVVTVGGRALKIKVGEGNLTYSEKVNRQYLKDRGILDEVRNGDEEPIDVKLDLKWEFLTASTSSATPTPEDVLKQRNAASTWVSSDSDTCRPYAIDIVVIHTPLCSGTKKERILLPDYRYESLDHDFKAGTLSTSGKCNAKEATVTRFT